MVTNLGQKAGKLLHLSPANSWQTRPNIAALLQLCKDGNKEKLICLTCVCKTSKQCKWVGAAPEYKTQPYSIAGLIHDLAIKDG